MLIACPIMNSRIRNSTDRHEFARLIVVGIISALFVTCSTGDGAIDRDGEREEVRELNRDAPLRGGVLAVPIEFCRVPDPAIDAASSLKSTGAASHGDSMMATPLVTEIHAGLTRIVDDPVRLFELELAETYKVDDAGTDYEFLLRTDLKFSDGSPLTAADFKWSWERALKKSVSGGRARDVFGLVEGADAVISGASEDLSGVVTVDDRTLRVSLTNPRAEFPALLADPVAYVLKKENVALWGTVYKNSGIWIVGLPFIEANMPVGAGPFKLANHAASPQHGAVCSIVRNPHYWGDDTYLDAVWYRWQRRSDGSFDSSSFAEERADFEAQRELVVIKEFEKDGESHVEKIVVARDMTEVAGAREASADFGPTYIFLVLNAAVPPFDDVHFRRAVTAFGQLTTYGGTLDPDARLVTGELTMLEPIAEFLRYDPVLARSELAASKYADETTTWAVKTLFSARTSPDLIQDASFISWSEKLNITLEGVRFDPENSEEFDRRYADDHHIRIYNVSPSYPDPITILRSLAAPFGKINRAPEFEELDAMLAEAAAERDAVKRHELYLDIENYVAENALVIPIVVERSLPKYRVHPWVHDLNPPKYAGSVFHNVWLDETAPQRELPAP